MYCTIVNEAEQRAVVFQIDSLLAWTVLSEATNARRLHVVNTVSVRFGFPLNTPH